jgi:hypothetical protein
MAKVYRRSLLTFYLSAPPPKGDRGEDFRTVVEDRMAQRRREKDRAKESEGPSYYIVRRHRLGDAMLDFARRYTNAGPLSPSKAAKVLGVKPRSVYPLLARAA